MRTLSELIAENQDEIIARWATKVAGRLGLECTRTPQLINDMPELLDDLVVALQTAPEHWRATTGRAHARQRLGLGVDIGGLSEEFGMVGEAVLEVAAEHPIRLDPKELGVMLRFLARGTAESVTEYGRLTTLEMRRQSAKHFSFVAHELRTPLQSALLAWTILKDGAPEGTSLDRLGGSLLRLSRMIDNSLVDARLTAEPEIRKESVMASAIVADAVDASLELAEQRRIGIQVDTEDFEFDADHRLLVSALTNLIVNGVKFSKPGGNVTVKASLNEDRVHIEVRDSCGGLPEGAAGKMFQQFAQVGQDRSGFGLGLLIVKQAIEAHGGRVRVADEPGRGCRMLVEMPRCQSRHSRVASASDAE